ncbi:hypothetical protein EB001_23300 [bacterium]|nr:hypothetical protein [bacterium]
MIETYDGVKIGLFKYNMTKDFAEEAISTVIDICSKPNINNKRISDSPIVSFWNLNDSGKRLYDLPIFKDYLSFIKPHIQEYLKELGVVEDQAILTAMWGVHYKPNQFVKRHNHAYGDYKKNPRKKRSEHIVKSDNDVLAILLYLNKPNNSGNLFIETPNGIEHEFDLKAGDVIMFPSFSLMHRTNPNLSNEDKFVVGIEIVMKWVTDDTLVGKTIGEL